MTYSVLLAPPAERQFRSFPFVVQKRLVKRMKALQNDPRPPGVKKLADKDDLYLIREGDYRIIYMIQGTELVILILKNGNRKEVYR